MGAESKRGAKEKKTSLGSRRRIEEKEQNINVIRRENVIYHFLAISLPSSNIPDNNISGNKRSG